MVERMTASEVIAKVNKEENFSVPEYEDAEELTRNQLIGEVNRLGYLNALLSIELDKRKVK